ncbi:unnamed protein product [Rotaria sp. Silwood1]|nr:unnamed protein product [Rotaria sp. Silwood1]
MATTRPSSSNTTTSSAIVIHQLAELLRTNGHRVLHGDSKVCFTSDSLTLLNNYFHSAKLNITLSLVNGHPRTNSLPPLPPLPTVQHLTINTKLREDLVFLHDFLQKIQVVKLIHNSPTLQGNVLLYPFQQVVCLELKKIPPHMVLGLSLLRHQLETLICSQSVTKIEDLINDCGGDSTQPQAWPRLKSLFLAHNFIECLDQSLKHLVALEVLDLSHNRLQDCSKILDIIPDVKHLNLSSNHLRTIPIWSETKGSCRLLTLKIRQNSIEDIAGVELMKSIEELDLSDNFITRIPEQIQHMPMIKRLYFARNPFTYASNYRQNIIYNLPFIFSQETRELMIDNEQLTTKEKQRIPRKRNPPSNRAQGFRFNTPILSSSQNTTTSESTTEPESVVTNSSGTIVSRRRSRRKLRDGHLKSLDNDETPTEHATSGSENESAVQRRHLGKLVESRHEVEHNYLTSQLSLPVENTYTTAIVEHDDTMLKSPPSTSIASSIPRKLANDLSKSPKRRKSPRSRKSDQPTKIILEVVDFQNTLSDATPIPDSSPSEKEISFNAKYSTTIIPKHEIELITNEENNTGGIEIIFFFLIYFNEYTTCLYSFSCSDSIRTIFFVTDQTFENNNRSFTIEIDRMYLIEKDNNDKYYIEKLKYSTIKLLTNNESIQKTVEFTFEKRRGEVERRIYLFDTIHDQKAFVEEIERHLELPMSADIKTTSSSLVECTKCGRSFPEFTTMNNAENTSSYVCSNCQTTAITLPPVFEDETQSKISIDISSDAVELDHRLHFHLATEHFTHNNEQIKLHFKCFVVRSTTSKYFIAQTVLTDYGIYIFQYEAPNNDIESEYILVGKDLLTNVLMLDIGYRLQTFTIELQSAAFAFILADQQKTQKIINHILEVLSPIVQSGEGALQKISRISSDEYRQRLFDIIKIECNINEPNDDMIDFYSTMIRMDQTGNSQMIALLLLQNWILMIEDAYATIDSRHVRLPAQLTSESGTNQQLKCDLMHLVNVTNYLNHQKLLVFDFVDESETKQFRWKLESITNESKNEFLRKVRDTYKKFMGIPIPEKLEML